MIKKTLLILSLSTLLFAQSTMCYKENHLSPSTIETITLNGGECNSKKSVQDMKNDGWIISNISINAGTSGMNYMYVFSKESNISNIPVGSLTKEDLRAQFKEIAKEEKVSLEKARIKKEKDLGKSIYKNTCSKCHGQNAEIKAYNVGNPLVNMTSEDIQIALRAYSLEDTDQNYGLTLIMKPYADALLKKEAKAVAEYIQTLK